MHGLVALLAKVSQEEASLEAFKKMLRLYETNPDYYTVLNREVEAAEERLKEAKVAFAKALAFEAEAERLKREPGS